MVQNTQIFNRKTKFLLFIFSFIILALIAAVGVLFWLVLRHKKNTNVLYLGDNSQDSQLKTLSTLTKLYTYYTKAEDLTLRKYSGKYRITLSDTSNTNFVVQDENGRNITGNVTMGENKLPTEIEFNTVDEASEINLFYTTTGTPSLLKLEIEI